MRSSEHTQTSAPHGSIGTIGHPGNQVYVVKTQLGAWRYVDTGRLVEDEDFRAGWDLLHTPEGHISNNYFIQAEQAAQMMDEWKTNTITSLRRGAADEENPQAFRDMCTAQADELEQETTKYDEL